MSPALRERQGLADAVASLLIGKTYGELLALANSEARADEFLSEHGFDPRRVPHVSLIVNPGGRLRKKVCVEITVIDTPMYPKSRQACVYFEKYSNGKLVAYGFRRG